MWMNEGEIDHQLEIANRYFPEMVPFAQYLSDWRDEVNATSDGWPYWSAGSKCASKLSEHLSKMRDSYINRVPLPTEAEMKKALTPIKSFATKHNRTAPTLQSVPAPAMR